MADFNKHLKPMNKLEQQHRYLLGLNDPAIKHRWAVDSSGRAEQYILGTDEHGLILWAPDSKKELIGLNIERLDVHSIEEIEETR